MIAALKLISAVAREDEAACVSICENLQWDAVNCMFGKALTYNFYSVTAFSEETFLETLYPGDV